MVSLSICRVRIPFWQASRVFLVFVHLKLICKFELHSIRNSKSVTIKGNAKNYITIEIWTNVKLFVMLYDTSAFVTKYVSDLRSANSPYAFLFVRYVVDSRPGYEVPWPVLSFSWRMTTSVVVFQKLIVAQLFATLPIFQTTRRFFYAPRCPYPETDESILCPQTACL
jgi:hypothetical protein